MATATIIPTAMARAAAAIAVRRRDAGNAAAARLPSMGKTRFMSGRRSADAVTSADGASAEKAATTNRTEIYPPTATPFTGGRIADPNAAAKQITAATMSERRRVVATR